MKESTDTLQDLLLSNTNTQDGPYILDGKILKSMKSHSKTLKQKAILDLKKFNGYHGNGYFVLGKPLLTSVVTNIITYSIILIQFKVSELSM